MEIYDVIMLVVVIAAAAFGFVKGLAWQVASLASLVISYFVALTFSTSLAPTFGTTEPWNRFAAMLVIFVVVGAAIWFLFRLVSAVIERVKLQEFDRQLGALVGGAKGVLLCLAITFFLVSLSETARNWILPTRSGYYAAWLMDQAHPVMPEEMHDVLEPFIHQLDDTLPEELRGRWHDADEHAQTQSSEPVWTQARETLGGMVEEALVERVGPANTDRK